jgi:hypothetical protein
MTDIVSDFKLNFQLERCSTAYSVNIVFKGGLTSRFSACFSCCALSQIYFLLELNANIDGTPKLIN